MFARVPNRFRCGLLLAFALLVTMGIGCGSGAYEERLSHTVGYYKYQNRLANNLSQKTWKGNGVALRIPNGFEEIAPPEPPEVPEGEELPEDAPPPVVIDNRQPKYLNIDLPGLVGAWVQLVNVEAGTDAAQPGATEENIEGDENTEPPQGPIAGAFIHILCNAEIAGSGQSVFDIESGRKLTAGEFNGEVLRRVLADIGIVDPGPGLMNQFLAPSGPGPHFVAQNIMEVAAFDLSPNQTRYQRLFGGDTARLSIYQTNEGPVQVTILTVTPVTAPPNLRLPERFEMMMETLKLDDELPRPDVAQPAGGGNKPKGPDF